MEKQQKNLDKLKGSAICRQEQEMQVSEQVHCKPSRGGHQLKEHSMSCFPRMLTCSMFTF